MSRYAHIAVLGPGEHGDTFDDVPDLGFIELIAAAAAAVYGGYQNKRKNEKEKRAMAQAAAAGDVGPPTKGKKKPKGKVSKVKKPKTSVPVPMQASIAGGGMGALLIGGALVGLYLMNKRRRRGR